MDGMSPRRRHLLGEPSEHDKSHAPDRSDYRRPLGAPHPTVPQNTRPVRTFARRAAWVLVAALVLLVAGYAALVIQADKAEPAPPSNQPSESGG